MATRFRHRVQTTATGKNMAKRVRYVPIDSLHLDPKSWGEFIDEEVEPSKLGLIRLGQQRPVVVDANGKIIQGAAMWRAAKELGWQTIGAIVSTLTPQQAWNNVLLGLGTFGVSDFNLACARVLFPHLEGLDDPGPGMDV